MSAFRARYPDVHLDLSEGLFPEIKTPLRAGILDCHIEPPPRESPGTCCQKLFDYTRVILGRKGHPLAHVRTLRKLIDAEWLATSATFKIDEELGPIFSQHGLAPPHVVVQAHSARTFIVAAAYSDLLTMLPVQWMQFPITRDALQKIGAVETLPAPPICIVRRAGLSFTPAGGNCFCDMMRLSGAVANAGDHKLAVIFLVSDTGGALTPLGDLPILRVF